MHQSKKTQFAVSLAMLIFIFVSLNMASNLMFRQERLDLTQNQLFTLSAGSREILEALDEPVALTFYYSQGMSRDFPALRQYGQRVRDMLDELVAASAGKLSLTIIDPVPYSEAEDVAVMQGLVGRPTATGELVYLGLVGTNMVDDTQVIPVFAQERADYLEYDLVRMIDNLNTPERPVLGVMSNLPLDTGTGGLMLALRGQSQPFLIYSELIDRFKVEFLEPDLIKIPTKIDVLLVAHPRPLSDDQAYAIDQFVLRGGRLIVFLDPYSEVSLTAGPNGAPLQGATDQSNMPKLMAQWGIDMPDDIVAADRQYAQRVSTGRDARRRLVDYVLWMGLGPEVFDRSDVIMSNIDLLNIGSPGVLVPRSDATTNFAPLITTSADAMLLPRDTVMAGPDPDQLLRGFNADGQYHAIAGRVSGAVRSAFPKGAPSENYEGPAHQDMTADANIIVFADSDFFDDRFWTTEENYLGQRFAVPMADNAKFLLNAVENMMGSDALISLRGRERHEAVFTTVANLRRAAEEQYLAEENNLREQIAAAQAELDRLEKNGSLDKTAQDVTQRYRQELQQARKALRQVEGNLRRDIEQLGVLMRWVNIALMPAVVLLVSLGLMVRRRRRRAATQKAGGFRMVDAA